VSNEASLTIDADLTKTKHRKPPCYMAACGVFMESSGLCGCLPGSSAWQAHHFYGQIGNCDLKSHRARCLPRIKVKLKKKQAAM
jgi:hypothetical protein